MARLCLMVAAGVALASPTARAICPGGEARGGVCREVEAEESVAVQLLQVGKQRVIENTADSLRVQVNLTQAAQVNVTQAAQVNSTQAVQANVTANATHAVQEGAQQIPGFGDLINSATNAMNDAVSEINNVVGGVTGSITDITAQVADIPTEAALTTARTLNETLLSLGGEAVKVRTQCWEAKDDILAKLDATSNDTSSKVAAFQVEMDAAVNQLLPLWQELSASVSTATTAASTVLKTVGQESIATSLESNVRLALDKGDSFSQSLASVPQQLSGLNTKSREEVVRTLDSVRVTFDKAQEQVEAVADQLTETFEGLATQAAAQLEKIPGVNATAVSEAFASVAATADEVVSEVVAGPKDFVGNLSAFTKAAVDEARPNNAGHARLAVGLLALVLASLAVHA